MIKTAKNPRKGKIPYNLWLNKIEIEEIETALRLSSDYEAILMIIGKIVRDCKERGDFQKR